MSFLFNCAAFPLTTNQQLKPKVFMTLMMLWISNQDIDKVISWKKCSVNNNVISSAWERQQRNMTKQKIICVFLCTHYKSSNIINTARYKQFQIHLIKSNKSINHLVKPCYPVVSLPNLLHMINLYIYRLNKINWQPAFDYGMSFKSD